MKYGLVLLLTLASGLPLAVADEPPREELAFFESRIRPLLLDKCHECHGPDTAEGELRLDSRAAILAGGESGPAAVSGRPDESLLIDAVHYRSLEMPPSEKLSENQIAALTQWIQSGLPWPGGGGEEVAMEPRRPGTEISARDREHWAFQPVRSPAPPQDPETSWDESRTAGGGNRCTGGFFCRELINRHRPPGRSLPLSIPAIDSSGGKTCVGWKPRRCGMPSSR